ncbi:hypothetical protein [Caldivirga sp.]|uniref:hypothetical protein n=1 Tax=Caldivirga sp. TaxID=2080243 RepID=UPI0025BB5BF0|nr:hypothetical protein [Caldivirga sp.]
MSSGLSNIVWTIIGVVLSVIVAAILWVFVSNSMGTYSQLLVSAGEVTPSMIQATIKNMGLGSVTIIGVNFTNQDGNQVTCTVTNVYVNGVPINLTKPVVLKGGDQLVVDAEGVGCVYAYYVIVKTSNGYYSSVVND